MFYKLHFFKKSNDGICGADFKNERQGVTINISYVLSVSDLLLFETPLTGKTCGLYGIVIMSNNDKYYINDKEYVKLMAEVNGLKLITAEDVKRWHALLVGYGEAKMKEDIKLTLNHKN